MKHIFVNLKRFDIPKVFGGVNSLCEQEVYGKKIMEETAKAGEMSGAEFAIFFPEVHIIEAMKAKKQANSKIEVGCQGVYRQDVAVKGNFGAFTTNKTASSMKNLGVEWTIIGHLEERIDKNGILAEAGVTDPDAVSRLLNSEIKCAQKQNMKVLFCVGEKMEELDNKYEVLKNQLEIGLEGVDLSNVVVAYEPVWAIGPGKTPPTKEYITDIAKHIKSVVAVDVVYGGGLKADNAKMLSEIEEIDGGLIALTRFSGDIGFYPEEYLEIVSLYLSK